MKRNANISPGVAASHSAPRLYVECPLAAGRTAPCSPPQAHYLANVMRLKPGARVLLFNGRDGEWLAEIASIRRNVYELAVLEKVRDQSGGPDILYLFAPLKKARLDYAAQKATELGVAALRPVLTRRTVAERVKIERMRANAIEAAEQCGVLRVPEIFEPEKLETALEGWPPERTLVFADEAAPVASPLVALRAVPSGPSALIIGPEGGFDPDERRMLLGQPFVHAVSLGPRVMRADTAAVAALALMNAILGDWR